jgi:hypothetical protein
MTDLPLDQDDQYYGFFISLKEAAAYCASAADYYAKSTYFSEKAREHRIAFSSEKENAGKADSFLEKVKKHQEQYFLYKKSALDLIYQAINHSRHALDAMFFNPRYSSQPFANLLVFLQRLSPKKAAETLKNIIVIMTNAEVKKFMQEEEIRVSRGLREKNLWAISYFRVMEIVFKNALFCESIKINHRLNFSTNFLGFYVASLQYQGKMAQMHSIVYERLEMSRKRRHNLLNISAFLYFLFRRIFKFPGNIISTSMKRLLNK